MEDYKMSQLKSWVTLSRIPFHTVGILPLILGVVIAWSEGFALRWDVIILSIVAVILIMLVTYYGGEYFDYETDSINTSYNKFSGGTRALFSKVVPRRHVLIATYVCLVLTIAIGIIIQFYCHTGVYTIPLGAFGLLCGYFYTGKPIQWAYHGVGEVLIGICYGWLPVNTAYYLLTGEFALIPTLVSIPIVISIFLVILINEFPDYDSDRLSSKKNLVVRFGQSKMGTIYAILLPLCFPAMVAGLLYSGCGALTLLSLMLIPLIVWNVTVMKRKGYRGDNALEGICARTIFANWMISGFSIIEVVPKFRTGC